MAKASSDRNTIDLFGKPLGRPRTSSLPRKEQIKFNKRNQRQKEKAQGLKRLEFTIDQESLEKLDLICSKENIKRSEWLIKQIQKSNS